ncbi:hypothetical protein DNTS_031596, partial [Danionella cerebrum]
AFSQGSGVLQRGNSSPSHTLMEQLAEPQVLSEEAEHGVYKELRQVYFNGVIFCLLQNFTVS